MFSVPISPGKDLSRKGVPGAARRGAAAVEFALVAPLLFLLILGMVEFGRMLMVQQILTNGAREGARKAVLPGVSDSQVNQTIDDYLSGAGISGFSRSVSPSASSAAEGSPITVVVSVPYQNVTWIPVPAFLGNRTLTAQVIMRKEEE
jgi:Flp pilus assembly protein TadG